MGQRTSTATGPLGHGQIRYPDWATSLACRTSGSAEAQGTAATRGPRPGRTLPAEDAIPVGTISQPERTQMTMRALPLRAGLVSLVLAVSTLTTVAITPVGAASPGVTVAPATATWTAFLSPNKNIGCYVDADLARCEVFVHTYKPTKKPASCKGDWGTASEVRTKGKGHFKCSSGTIWGPSPILKYGHSKFIGRFTCTSRSTGMTCINRWNGHGFKVAKASYHFF